MLLGADSHEQAQNWDPPLQVPPASPAQDLQILVQLPEGTFHTMLVTDADFFLKPHSEFKHRTPNISFHLEGKLKNNLMKLKPGFYLVIKTLPLRELLFGLKSQLRRSAGAVG